MLCTNQSPHDLQPQNETEKKPGKYWLITCFDISMDEQRTENIFQLTDYCRNSISETHKKFNNKQINK